MNGFFVIKRGNTTIADGEDSIVTDGPKINGQRLLDVAPFLFADRPTIYDRNTDSDTCEFTITQSHALFAAAFDHAARHGRTVRGVADLRIELTEGAATTVWLARDAGWEATAIPAPAGVATSVQYRVLCPFFEVDDEASFVYENRLFGGAAGATQELLYHGGAAGDTHLNLLRQWHGGATADRA